MAPDSVSFADRLVDGWQRSNRARWLVFVPVVTALLSLDKITRVASHSGFSVGFKLFLFPSPAENVWTYVRVPQSGITVETPGPLWLLPVSVLVHSVLLGGFLGSVRRLLDAEETEFAFVRDSLAYLRQMTVWTGIPIAVFGGLALAGGSGRGSPASIPPLAIGLLFVSVVVLSYLFYAAPFLVVLRDAGILDALTASYRFAVGGGAYAAYGFAYVAFGLVVSAVASTVVVNLGIVGLLVGVPAGARLGLATSTATMRFVSDLDPESPTLCAWGGDTRDGSDGRDGAARREAPHEAVSADEFDRTRDDRNASPAPTTAAPRDSDGVNVVTATVQNPSLKNTRRRGNRASSAVRTDASATVRSPTRSSSATSRAPTAN